MDTSKDHYAILGVLPTAEDFVIQAAYRALSKVYHPDRYKGDDADQKMSEINEAYEVLGNKSKREQYDQQRICSCTDDGEFFNDNFNAGTNSYDPFYDDWKVATEYYPELDDIADDLAHISSRLSFSFRIYVLQEKKYSTAKKVAKLMKQNFLTQFFGSNKLVHDYAIELIGLKRKDVLLDLNRSIKVMGSGESEKIVKQISAKSGIKTKEQIAAETRLKYISLIESIDSYSKLLRSSDEYYSKWKTGKISDEELLNLASRIKKSGERGLVTVGAILFISLILFILFAIWDIW